MAYNTMDAIHSFSKNPSLMPLNRDGLMSQMSTERDDDVRLDPVFSYASLHN
jgi:hypothetical protein